MLKLHLLSKLKYFSGKIFSANGIFTMVVKYWKISPKVIIDILVHDTSITVG